MTTSTTTEPTYDELRALVLELDAAPYTVTARHGKHEGMADLNLRIPSTTVHRFWRLAARMKQPVEKQEALL